MPNNSVGVPTVRSMGNAFQNYGVGFLGGAVHQIARGFLGNGLFASITAPLLAGSIVKGSGGDAISTIAGYEAARAMLGAGNGGNNGGGGGRGEM